MVTGIVDVGMDVGAFKVGVLGCAGGLEEEMSIVVATEETDDFEVEGSSVNMVEDLTKAGGRGSVCVIATGLAVEGGTDAALEVLVVLVEGGAGTAKLELDAALDGGGKSGTRKPELEVALVGVVGIRGCGAVVARKFESTGDWRGVADGGGGRGEGGKEGGRGVIVLAPILIEEGCFPISRCRCEESTMLLLDVGDVNGALPRNIAGAEGITGVLGAVLVAASLPASSCNDATESSLLPLAELNLAGVRSLDLDLPLDRSRSLSRSRCLSRALLRPPHPLSLDFSGE